MTRFKREIPLHKFSTYCNNRTKKPTEFLSEMSEPANGLLWTDPNVISGNTAFQVRKRCGLPRKFNEILAQTAPGDAKIISGNHKKYCALITPSVICLYIYCLPTSVYAEIQLTDQYNTLPLVNIFYTKEKISLSVASSESNKIRYYDNVMKSTAVIYPLRLRSSVDKIATTCKVNGTGKFLLVGTLMGDLYPLKLQEGAIQLVPSPKLKSSGMMSYVSAFFVNKPSIDSPASIYDERIISIVNVLDTVYVLTEKHIQVWKIKYEFQLECIANIPILKDLTKSISGHIPENISSENIRIEALDIDSKLKNELVLLSSYQLPEMGGYIQYAASTISIKKNDSDNETTFRIKHTTSAPFSAQQKSNPKLSISKSLAFITFDSHIIAVSRNKKSAFEESVVLLEDDHILCALVENDGQEGSMESAIIYTEKNGIFDFDIDIHKIQGPEIDGNVYAGYVSNKADSDTNAIQSKLEQAVLFGASHDRPIQFPLSIEREDISTATSRVLKEMMENTMFLPVSLDAELRAEARYVFVNRIFQVLLENDLILSIDSTLRLKLMNCAEMCSIGVFLLQEYKSISEDELLQMVWLESIKKITPKEDQDIKEFFNTNVLESYRFLDEALCICFTEIIPEENRIRVIYKMIDIIIRVLELCRHFRDSYYSLYEIEDKDKANLGHPFNTFSASFNTTIGYIKDNKLDNSELAERLCDMAEMLLDCSMVDKKLENVELAPMIEKLLSVGKLEFSMKLAKKYEDLRIIVSTTNNNTKEQDIIKRNSAWIKQFGTPYLVHLFQWLVDQGKDEEIFKFDLKYLDQVDKFASENKLKSAWKYYLKRKQYQKCRDAIFDVLPDENKVYQRQELLSYGKMVVIKTEQEKGFAQNTFASRDVIDISAELALNSIQVQLINEFDKYLLLTRHTDKLTTIMNRYYLKSKLRNDANEEKFKTAIKELIQGIALDRQTLIFVLIYISGYKTIEENFINALKLTLNAKELRNMIWKEVYHRDIIIYQKASCRDFSDEVLQNILQQTLLFRIISRASKYKHNIGDMIQPENIEFEDKDDDSASKVIKSDGFKQFINQMSL